MTAQEIQIAQHTKRIAMQESRVRETRLEQERNAITAKIDAERLIREEIDLEIHRLYLAEAALR